MDAPSLRAVLARHYRKEDWAYDCAGLDDMFLSNPLLFYYHVWQYYEELPIVKRLLAELFKEAGIEVAVPEDYQVAMEMLRAQGAGMDPRQVADDGVDQARARRLGMGAGMAADEFDGDQWRRADQQRKAEKAGVDAILIKKFGPECARLLTSPQYQWLLAATNQGLDPSRNHFELIVNGCEKDLSIKVYGSTPSHLFECPRA